MKYITSLILLIGLLAGQLFKFPQGNQGGATLLDLAVIILILFSIPKIKLQNLKLNHWTKAAFIFSGVAIISLILTPLRLSTSQYLLSLAYPFRFTLYFLLGFLISNGALPTLKKTLPKTILFSGIGLAVLGLLQLIFIPDLGFMSEAGWDPHYFRTVSTLLDPNFLGAYLVLTLLSITLDQSISPTIKKRLPGFIITYLAIITTFSRSAAIMLFVSFTALALLKRSPKLLLLSIFLTGGVGLGFLGYKQLVAQPRGIDRQQSAYYRLNSWQEGWTMLQYSPVFGVGFNAYRFALSQYHLGTENFSQTRGASANDSSLLFVAATTGVVGLAVFFAFLTTLIQGSLFKVTQNKWNLVIVSGLLGLIAQSFFINVLFYPWILIWVILVTVYAQSKQ